MTAHTYSPAHGQLVGDGLAIARVNKAGRHARVDITVNVERAKQKPAMARVNFRGRIVADAHGIKRLLGADGGPQAVARADGQGLANLLTACEQGAPQREHHLQKLAARFGYKTWAGLWKAIAAQGGAATGKAVREVIGFA